MRDQIGLCSRPGDGDISVTQEPHQLRNMQWPCGGCEFVYNCLNHRVLRTGHGNGDACGNTTISAKGSKILLWFTQASANIQQALEQALLFSSAGNYPIQGRSLVFGLRDTSAHKLKSLDDRINRQGIWIAISHDLYA